MKILANAVDNALRNHFFVCDTTEFLESFLPVPQTCVHEVFERLCKNSVYKDGRWARLPYSDSVGEDENYMPFIDIANSISDAAKTSSGFTSEGRVNGVWVNRQSNSSKSRHLDTADIRPDSIYVASNDAIEKLDRIIAQAREELDTADVSAKDKRKSKPHATADNSEKRGEKEVRC
jgi:hypothetical protein